MNEYLNNLKELSTALDDYADQHPHVLPYALLEESKGESAILHEDAEKLWDEIAQRLPDDGLAQHHLAVMRHASAFRLLKRDQHGPEARERWLAGLKHWKRVIDSEEFWNHLTKVWTERRDSEKGEKLAERLLSVDLQAFRRALPSQLLKVHVEIIQANISSQPEAARAHISLIRNSGFSEATVRDSLNLVYNMAVGARKNAAPEQAAQAIEDYLEIDQGNIRALRDRLEVAIRACDDKQNSVQTRLSAMRAARARADLLKSKSGNSDPDRDRSREVLRDFYVSWAETCFSEGVRLYNDDQSANALFRESCEKAGDACEFETSGMKARTLYRKAVSHVAISSSEDPQASLRLVEKAIKRFPKDAANQVSLAQVRLAKGDVSGANSALTAAEKANSLGDQEVVAQIKEVRSKMEMINEFGSLATVDLLIAAVNRMQKSEWRAAISKFESARRSQPRQNESTLKLLLLKRNCHQSMGDYSGLAQCTNDIQSVARSLGLVVNI